MTASIFFMRMQFGGGRTSLLARLPGTPADLQQHEQHPRFACGVPSFNAKREVAVFRGKRSGDPRKVGHLRSLRGMPSAAGRRAPPPTPQPGRGAGPDAPECRCLAQAFLGQIA